MATLVRPGGRVFMRISQQPVLALYVHRHTADFILDDLLRNVSAELKDAVANDLKPRLRMDAPAGRLHLEGSQAPGNDAIHRDSITRSKCSTCSGAIALKHEAAVVSLPSRNALSAERESRTLSRGGDSPGARVFRLARSLSVFGLCCRSGQASIVTKPKPEMRILYFSRNWTTHDQRFLRAIVAGGHDAWLLRWEKCQPAFGGRRASPRASTRNLERTVPCLTFIRCLIACDPIFSTQARCIHAVI